MHGLSLDLNDPEMVWVDNGARSVAYFCLRTPVMVDKELIRKLKEIAAALNGTKNVRLCLHDSPKAIFHNMIVLENKIKYYRPHKHPSKSETFHIIEGTMAVIVFAENGQIENSSVLDAQENFLYRVDANTYHAVMPLSDLVIYHESKPGPFIGKSDIYPSWAPEESNIELVNQYKQRMLELLGRIL